MGNEEKKVLALCVKAGEILLRNGGEIFRVQETMLRIAAAFGAETFHVYVLSNGVFASIGQAGEVCGADIRMVPLSPVHLGRVCAVNSLSREISAGQHTMEEASARLDDISRIPFASAWVHAVASCVGSACFCYIFGGSLFDSLTAMLCGMLLFLFVQAAGKRGFSKIITNILGSALVTLCAIALFTLHMGDAISRIIIGSIVPLLPGVALTTSIRDFLNSDYLSGTIRLIDAVLIAACIAIGVGVVLKIWSVFGGVMV